MRINAWEKLILAGFGSLSSGSDVQDDSEKWECVTGRECTPDRRQSRQVLEDSGAAAGLYWSLGGSVCGNWWEECDRRLGQMWRLFSRVEVPSLSWSHSQLSQVLTGFCLCAGKIILGNMKSTEQRKPEENETTEWIVEIGGRWWDSKVGCWQWVEVGRLNLRHLGSRVETAWR